MTIEFEPIARRAIGRGCLTAVTSPIGVYSMYEIVLANEDDRNFQTAAKLRSLMERADIGSPIAEEADRTSLSPCTARARQPRRQSEVRADDRIGTHYAMLDRRQVHRAALAAKQPVVAAHQLAQHSLHRNPASERVGVPAIGAERFVVLAHGDAEPGRDGLLTEREVAGPPDQVLEERVRCARFSQSRISTWRRNNFRDAALKSDVVVPPAQSSQRVVPRFHA